MFPELGHPESVGLWFNRAGAQICKWFQMHRCWFNHAKIRVIDHGGVKVRGSCMESNSLKALHPHLGLPWSWMPIILTGLAPPGSPASTLLGLFLVEHIQPFFTALYKMHLTTPHCNTTRPPRSWKGPSLIAETLVSPAWAGSTIWCMTLLALSCSRAASLCHYIYFLYYQRNERDSRLRTGSLSTWRNIIKYRKYLHVLLFSSFGTLQIFPTYSFHVCCSIFYNIPPPQWYFWPFQVWPLSLNTLIYCVLVWGT